jgi:integrase
MEPYMRLTDTEIRNAKIHSVAYKLADGRGLYLLVQPNGSKLWRMKYRFGGKEKKLSFGSYPQVSLKLARSRCEDARANLEIGRDPSQLRLEAKLAVAADAFNSFEAVAEEYITKREEEGWALNTLSKARWLLAELTPLHRRPVREITPMEILAILTRIKKEGKRETARRLRSFCGRVFRFAVATGRADLDPAESLKGALTAPVVKHRAAITDPKTFGELLRAIESYDGNATTRAALHLSAHLFQRPGEIRQMEWVELKLAETEWIIPAARMKARRPHKVPLSRQVIATLEGLRPLTGNGRYVFGGNNSRRPMSENTVNKALRRLGYAGDMMTAHGFRSTASSLLNESGRWNPDAIERALAHGDPDRVRSAYHRADYWDERVEMAQWWSDYIDALRDGADIIPFPVRSV